MRIKKFFAIITRSLLSVFLFGLLLVSLTDFNFQNVLKGLFEDVYTYADAGSRQYSMDILDDTCTVLLQGRLDEFRELCNNKQMFDRINDQCLEYYNLRSQEKIEVDLQVEETCRQVTSGDFEKTCTKTIKDSAALGALCEQHKNGIIGDRDFFSNFMLGTAPFPESVFSPSTLILPLALVCFALAAILLMLLSPKEWLWNLGRILFHLGVLSVIMYSVITLYISFSPPDTSFVLNFLMNPGQNLIADTILVLLPLVLARMISVSYLYLGIIAIVMGLALKYIFKLEE